jgi:hypothetical protein
MPPARSTAATGAPGGLPPSFLSSQADKKRGDQAVEVANVHARASNRRAKQKVDIPNIEAADLPPNKPNLPPDRNTLRFAPESIPQGELTSFMQSQPLAEVHPFAPTLRKWQQGIPMDCGPDWERSLIEAAVDRGPHPTAQTPKSIALFVKDIDQGQILPGVPLGGTQASSASKLQDLPSSGCSSSRMTGMDHP